MNGASFWITAGKELLLLIASIFLFAAICFAFVIAYVLIMSWRKSRKEKRNGR